MIIIVCACTFLEITIHSCQVQYIVFIFIYLFFTLVLYPPDIPSLVRDVVAKCL